jgi:hypothetical protein
MTSQEQKQRKLWSGARALIATKDKQTQRVVTWPTEIVSVLVLVSRVLSGLGTLGSASLGIVWYFSTVYNTGDDPLF